MTRSVKVLSMYIAFLVPLSFTNPHCSSAISGVILFLVRCDSHYVAPGFFGKAIKIDFDKSEGIYPLYIYGVQEIR